MRAACETNPHLATFETIGHSEDGRPIAGITLGTGPAVVTLVAGAHADEPVGPETLRTLVLDGLAAQGWGAPGRRASTPRSSASRFRIVPHVNPDAEARNAPWIAAFDPPTPRRRSRPTCAHRLREPPGRDVEFAYPDARPETAAATAFLFGDGPPALHASLHGMGFAEGALLLIDRDHLLAPVDGGPARRLPARRPRRPACACTTTTAAATKASSTAAPASRRRRAARPCAPTSRRSGDPETAAALRPVVHGDGRPSARPIRRSPS